MSRELDMLHQQTLRRHPNYETFRADVLDYHAFANAITARLQFHWHPVGASNPRNNHQGGAYGSDHIVLDEPLSVGRLRREPGDALCKTARQFHGNLWMDSDGPTCKRCLEIAEHIIGQVEE